MVKGEHDSGVLLLGTGRHMHQPEPEARVVASARRKLEPGVHSTVMAPQASRIIPHPRLTWADYQQLPDDGNRYEILEGELVVTPAPEYRHQLASANLVVPVINWLNQRGDRGKLLHAPFDVVLAEDTIVQPDLVYMSEQTLRLIDKGRLHGVPDLVVEIFNERGAARDRLIKLQVYSRFRVREYWLVDLEARCITVLVLTDDGLYEQFASGSGSALLASRVLEGFTLETAAVFKDC